MSSGGFSTHNKSGDAEVLVMYCPVQFVHRLSLQHNYFWHEKFCTSVLTFKYRYLLSLAQSLAPFETEMLPIQKNKILFETSQKEI